MGRQFNLTEAAQYLGVLPDVLHQWTWAQTGPATIVRSYWFPTFTQESLDDWLSKNKLPEKPKGPEYRLGTKRVHRARKVQA